MADDIYGFIFTRMREVKTYVDSQIKGVRDDVEAVLKGVDDRIHTEILKLEKVLDKRRVDVVSDIMVIMVNAELRISDKIQTVSSKLNTEIARTSWNTGFFSIFQVRPELSFLKVLLRDQQTFDEFKPYWQALFTRVMAED